MAAANSADSVDARLGTTEGSVAKGEASCTTVSSGAGPHDSRQPVRGRGTGGGRTCRCWAWLAVHHVSISGTPVFLCFLVSSAPRGHRLARAWSLKAARLGQALSLLQPESEWGAQLRVGEHGDRVCACASTRRGSPAGLAERHARGPGAGAPFLGCWGNSVSRGDPPDFTSPEKGPGRSPGRGGLRGG